MARTTRIWTHRERGPGQTCDPMTRRIVLYRFVALADLLGLFEHYASVIISISCFGASFLTVRRYK